ncbi:hypothetical protein FBU30_003486 [Linnemannia zychae]|nr:hypothetical protein FBU30_003486 [Linnemannia zychae]
MPANTFARAGLILTRARHAVMATRFIAGANIAAGSKSQSLHSSIKSAQRFTWSTTTLSASRGFHSTLPGRNRPPSSWGDLIPQPRKSSSDTNNTVNIIITRPSKGPQYKRFDRNSSGRGMPIIYDRRYQMAAGAVVTVVGGYYVMHLERVPMTERIRFMDVSVKQEEKMAKEAYSVVMRQFHNQILPPNHPYTQYVKRVATRIIRAAGMENLEWEFYVVNSKEPNAFVLPGGKVFVFTGILPIAENEDGLATVLGHEIAHQLARHSAEKLSFTKVALFFGVIFNIIFDPSFSMNSLFMNLGLMLPFSRKCETEADKIGLQLMAQACFDPRESVRMWQRMSHAERGPNLSFLNTHPASKSRAVKLEEWMPEAMDTWRKSDCETISVYADMFNKANLAYW